MKIFISIFLTIGIIFASYYSFIISTLSGESKFYGPFIIVFFVGLITFINLLLFKKKGFNRTRNFFVVFLIIGIVSIVGKEMYDGRIEKLKVVSNQDVNLYGFMPFNSNEVAKLKEPSTFKLTKDLPRLDGSTALYPLYASFVQAVYPKGDYDPYDTYKGNVISSQTSGAFQRLLDGEVDIIFTPQPSKEIKEKAREKGLTLHMTPIGKEAFVFFVHHQNPIKGLTVEQLQGIYGGEIKNWNEVGGKNDKIRAFQRPEDSGSQGMLIRFMGNKKLMKAPSEVVTGMGEIINQTASYQNHKNAIGFSFRYFSEDMVKNGQIKNIEVNGVLPTKETIRDNSYPITAEFYAITTDKQNPNIHAFIEWMVSEQGQELVEKTGYVSIRP